MRIDQLNKEIRILKLQLQRKDVELKKATQIANKVQRFFDENFNKLIIEFNDFIASENWLKFDREPYLENKEKLERDKFR